MKPILTDERIQELLRMPKRLTRTRYAGLADPARPGRHPAWRESRASLRTDIPGFVVVTSRSLEHPDQYTAVLLFVNEDGFAYPILRCGSRPLVHTNRLERRTIAETRRVNSLTERYQLAARDSREIQEDGYAIAAGDAFHDLRGALDHLCRLANIAILPEETLE